MDEIVTFLAKYPSAQVSVSPLLVTEFKQKLKAAGFIAVRAKPGIYTSDDVSFTARRIAKR